MTTMQSFSSLAVLLLVLCGPALALKPERDHFQTEDQELDMDLDLRHHKLQQRARSAGFLSQEWNNRAMEGILSQLSLPEDDVQRDDEVASMGTGGRMKLERSVELPNMEPPRKREQGCKNFYWKGFTSC